MESQCMSVEIGLSYLLDQFQILTEGLTVGIPQVPNRGSSSLCLCGVGSQGCSVSGSCSGDQHCLALGKGTIGAGLLGQWGEVTGFLNLAVKGEVTIRGLGRDGLPINRWRGFISFTRALLGQAWRATPQA